MSLSPFVSFQSRFVTYLFRIVWTLKFNTCINSVEYSGSQLVSVRGRKENTTSPQYGYAGIFIFLIKSKAMPIGAWTNS